MEAISANSSSGKVLTKPSRKNIKTFLAKIRATIFEESGSWTAGELIDLFASISRFYTSIAPSEVRIVLIEAGAKLLADLPAGR